ncbi:DUF4188 domain-containing protein [Synechococcus sp. PCC 6312]|uniref:DUF4188 domain-containing protein n=1 Tax=Synechococcus sp. (strain ATCC 27167 / PCC 6312) TaxID=195253 RepID=UPI00029EECB0|nr:DUF4188 domain-containing protein [Synechococcus sp. PCC 6312]AFY60749.1 hypothetical protein Syn6312_1588 [Synechococcus sp. PCC 6312]
MAAVIPGRFTADTQQGVVVFLIGMRVNRFWAFSKWIPTARAMGPMLKVLYEFPEKGFLGQESFFRLFPPEIVLISYWRSFEHLEQFARNRDDPHLQAWQDFNRNIGSDGSVGIWHETYCIQPEQAEAIYVNMPIFGLAKATAHRPVTGFKATARNRLSQTETVDDPLG